ncbi:FeoA family protein [Pedomonas mirosovicensis]|uniref:FeoA family protein n=1 Tax=Pedomonas mirosovicensis TaxID=2908641 RepID=UPI00216AAD9D|nr:FeoA family protein [Pedomonas mirosovicensis]MCH8684762.1 ferrous iron transport protein A [Pedomonas mirosovicensis]
MSEQVTLGSLPPGTRARIVSIDAEADRQGLHLRLYEMGFDEGVEVEVLHRGPIGGDPIAVQVGGMIVAMRRAEAGLVRVASGAALLREAAE